MVTALRDRAFFQLHSTILCMACLPKDKRNLRTGHKGVQSKDQLLALVRTRNTCLKVVLPGTCSACCKRNKTCSAYCKGRKDCSATEGKAFIGYKLLACKALGKKGHQQSNLRTNSCIASVSCAYQSKQKVTLALWKLYVPSNKRTNPSSPYNKQSKWVSTASNKLLMSLFSRLCFLSFFLNKLLF